MPPVVVLCSSPATRTTFLFQKFSLPQWMFSDQSQSSLSRKTKKRPRANLFWQEMICFTLAHQYPGLFAFCLVLQPLLSFCDSEIAFQKISLLLLAGMDFCCSRHKDCECYGQEPVQITHTDHQSMGHRSRTRSQERGVRMSVHVRPGWVPSDTFYPCCMLLLIVLRWHRANGLPLEKDRTDFSTQLSYLPAQCPSCQLISTLARWKWEFLPCRVLGGPENCM